MSHKFIAFCLFVEALKLTTWLHAWFMVPLGFLLGGIRPGPFRRTQWAGHTYKGVQVTLEEAPQIRARWLWRIYDLPDEPSVGQYEPTVKRIWETFGWYGVVYYQLAFRNVGHGWPYLFRRHSDVYTREGGHPLPGSNTTIKKCGLNFGFRPYADWRAQEDATFSSDPESMLTWYYVPGVWRRIDW